MEDKTTQLPGSKDSQSDDGSAITSATKPDANVITIKGVNYTPVVDPVSDPTKVEPPEDTRTPQEKQLDYPSYNPRGSALYNEAIKDFDESSDDVQLAELYVYQDKEYNEHGNF